VKPRGTPREYPLVSGSCLNLTWPMFGSTRSKYFNRAVMVISFWNYNYIIICLRVATFKCGIFSVLHKCHETASISRNSRVGCVSRVQTRRPHTRVMAFLQVDCTSICVLERKSLTNFGSRVLASNKGLRVSRTSHESTRHLWNNASESDVTFKRYCT